MGRTGIVMTAEPARDFAHAVTHFVSEALLLMQRLDEDAPPSPAASRALDLAAHASEELERMAREDAHEEAYAAAACAFEAASVALAELRTSAGFGLVAATLPAFEEPVAAAAD